MCGIAGLFAKSSSLEPALGAHLSAMLGQLVDRGPDSTGVALYRAPALAGTHKLSVLVSDTDTDAAARLPALVAGLGATVLHDHGEHAVLLVEGAAEASRAWLAQHAPDVVVLGSGSAIEVHKRVGRPEAVTDGCGVRGLDATHALGHTRMATESKVTVAGAHPFSTGEDLCLVHNGSLSNHNRLRRDLVRRGVPIATENDSEVAAGFLTWRLREGDDLDTALHHALETLDGFFTFAVGTRDGFAVLRDPIACKPAIVAETDEWVAMASEFRALAVLPGAEDAAVFEPEPGRVYTWSHDLVVA